MLKRLLVTSALISSILYGADAFGSPTSKSLAARFTTSPPATPFTAFLGTNPLLTDPNYIYMYSNCSTYSNGAGCVGKYAFGTIPLGTAGVRDAQFAMNRMVVLSPNGSQTLQDVTIQNGQVVFDPNTLGDNQIGIVRLAYMYGATNAPVSTCVAKVYFCGKGVNSCPQDTAPSCFPLVGKQGATTTCSPQPSLTLKATPPTTPGGTDGVLLASVAGGSGGFGFSISPAPVSSSVTGNNANYTVNAAAGPTGKTYSVTATDTADSTCLTTASYVLVDPVAGPSPTPSPSGPPCTLPSFIVSITSTTSPTTAGGNNGTITVNVTGNSGPGSASVTLSSTDGVVGGAPYTGPFPHTFTGPINGIRPLYYTATATDSSSPSCTSTATTNLLQGCNTGFHCTAGTLAYFIPTNAISNMTSSGCTGTSALDGLNNPASSGCQGTALASDGQRHRYYMTCLTGCAGPAAGGTNTACVDPGVPSSVWVGPPQACNTP